MEKLKIYPGTFRKCEEHGVQGSLPCPWPGCTNGLASEQFEEDRSYFLNPSFDKTEPTIYSRRMWHSLLGEPYYSWDSSNLANWFFVSQTFWNEVRRLRLIDVTAPRVVFHYTSLEGLLGIIKSRSIWMSDFSHLNDSRELTYGADLVKSAINDIKAAESDVRLIPLFASWMENLSDLRNRVCIASFSADDDSLSQWRAYGPIAIGFVTNSLALHVNQSRMQRVEYEPESQRKLIDAYLHHASQAYLFDCDNDRLKRIEDVYHKIERLLELITFFKNPAFRSECEYRLAYIDNPEVVSRFGLRKTAKEFRISKGRLIPYVASTDVLPSGHRSFPFEIEQIVLGPECDDLLERGVRELLDSQDLNKVKVRRSVVPYRP